VTSNGKAPMDTDRSDLAKRRNMLLNLLKRWNKSI